MSLNKETNSVIPKEETKDARPKKKVKNVFTYMESTYESKGPKSLLYRSIKENRKIKVWTRSHSYVRSICTGYLVAFDQFWNLAMTDVDEVYKVPLNLNKSLNSNLDPELSNLNLEDDKLKSEFDEVESKLNLYKSGKFNLYERHVNQLLIRGDNIVTVALAD